jgi:Tfp pilus assembly protein PilF
MTGQEPKQKLGRLLAYLETDPGNATLLRDCAESAIAAGDMAAANDCFDRLEQASGLSEAEAGMAGIAAMRGGRVGRAIDLFRQLSEAHPDDPALRFNLAWSLALDKQFEPAQALLGKELTASLPQAAMLDLQISHERGDFEGAADRIAAYLDAHGDYAPLQAAVSVLAMDLDREDLARQAALAGGDHPDALATLGALTLGDGDPAGARELLERALAANPRSPRALIALGLSNLSLGATGEALRMVDQGAELFEDHLGSWIAAGWAHLVAGDPHTAEERFATAMRLDANFAECHGSLATLAALKGDRAAAEHAIGVALRLDRQCFSARFAQLVLAGSDGDSELAGRILEAALDQPFGAGQPSLRDLIGRLAR